jgi:hypothetical protein
MNNAGMDAMAPRTVNRTGPILNDPDRLRADALTAEVDAARQSRRPRRSVTLFVIPGLSTRSRGATTTPLTQVERPSPISSAA